MKKSISECQVSFRITEKLHAMLKNDAKNLNTSVSRFAFNILTSNLPLPNPENKMLSLAVRSTSVNESFTKRVAIYCTHEETNMLHRQASKYRLPLSRYINMVLSIHYDNDHVSNLLKLYSDRMYWYKSIFDRDREGFDPNSKYKH